MRDSLISAGNRHRRMLNRSRVVLCAVAAPLLLASLASIGGTFYRYIMVLVGFTIIIAIHELGHFLVARACSVKCEVYSIGIGPRMLGWKKGVGFSFGPEPVPAGASPSAQPAKTESSTADISAPLENSTSLSETPAAEMPGVATVGDLHQTADNVSGETDYRLSWLPLGGYVKMLGQDDMDPTAQSTDPRAFNRRPIWQRMCIISAGVIMNVILAFVLFAITFSVGIEFVAPLIGPVELKSPAAEAGFKMGDRVVKINGEAPRYGQFEFTDVALAAMLAPGGQPVHYTVQHADGTTQALSVVPKMSPVTGMQMIGVGPMPSLNVPTFKPDEIKLLAESDPALAALRSGDTVIAANGQPVHNYVELHSLIQQSAGQPVTLTLHNDKKGLADHTITLTPKISYRLGADTPVAVLGMLPQVAVSSVLPDSPASRAGLEPGDVVVRIEAMTYPSLDQFRKIVAQNADEPIGIDVLRGGKIVSLQVTPHTNKGQVQVGVEIAAFAGAPRVADVLDNSPAASANILPGALITKVNEQPVTTWAQTISALWNLPKNQPLTLTIHNSDGKNVALHAASDQLASVDQLQFVLGLPLGTLLQTQQAPSVAGAIWMGLDHTNKFIVQTYMTIRGLAMRTVSPSSLHGIVGITKIGADAQERGFMWLLYIMGLVSVNLAVINFLPLPIVDGGLFVLLLIEKIRGKPLEARVLAAINIAGLALLGCLFLFVTFNDITLFLPK